MSILSLCRAAHACVNMRTFMRSGSVEESVFGRHFLRCLSSGYSVHIGLINDTCDDPMWKKHESDFFFFLIITSLYVYFTFLAIFNIGFFFICITWCGLMSTIFIARPEGCGNVALGKETVREH